MLFIIVGQYITLPNVIIFCLAYILYIYILDAILQVVIWQSLEPEAAKQSLLDHFITDNLD